MKFSDFGRCLTCCHNPCDCKAADNADKKECECRGRFDPDSDKCDCTKDCTCHNIYLSDTDKKDGDIIDCAHIPTAEIREDKIATEREIVALTHDLTSAQIRRNRWDIMKAENGITKRREFINKLDILLKQRHD